ncbi:MAG: hypothetical protein K9N48_08890, partial [Verrucomicrobia bacterium]|nr:hypothetical protein [Verrucomicrobiota bacterium]
VGNGFSRLLRLAFGTSAIRRLRPECYASTRLPNVCAFQNSVRDGIFTMKSKKKEKYYVPKGTYGFVWREVAINILPLTGQDMNNL